MTHPDIEHAATGGVAAVLEPIEQARSRGHREFGVAEFTLAGSRDATAELLRHGLHAVADPEHRHAKLEHCGGRPRRIGGGDRLGAAGENHSARGESAYLHVTHVPGVNLAVDPELAHASGDELRVLRTKIEDQDAMRVDIGVRSGGGGVGSSSGNARHRQRVRTPGSWVPPW